MWIRKYMWVGFLHHKVDNKEKNAFRLMHMQWTGTLPCKIIFGLQVVQHKPGDFILHPLTHLMNDHLINKGCLVNYKQLLLSPFISIISIFVYLFDFQCFYWRSWMICHQWAWEKWQHSLFQEIKFRWEHLHL